jgi:hypothetical protein
MRLNQITESVVIVNNTLNPKIWNLDSGMPVLDEKISKKMIKIAKAFYKFIDINLNIIDVILTGSNANFTWNAHSDLDLHLLISGSPITNIENYLMLKNLYGGIFTILLLEDIQ